MAKSISVFSTNSMAVRPTWTFKPLPISTWPRCGMHKLIQYLCQQYACDVFDLMQGRRTSQGGDRVL